MSNDILSIVIWVAAAVILVLYIARRRARKQRAFK